MQGFVIKSKRMSDVIAKFSRWMEKETKTDPDKARKTLLLAYRAFGWYQKHFPDKHKTPPRQYLANSCMNFMIRGFSHPENAAMVSIFLPCELLQAFDISPICAEMFSTYLNGAASEKPFIDAAEAEGISETYCSYHKVVMGAASTHVLPKTKVIVNTSLACDANNLTFRQLSRMMGTPQYYLDVPYQKNEAAVAYVAGQFHEIAEGLEAITGRKLDEEKLRQAVLRSHETIANFRKTIPYRKERYVPSDLTSELYEALISHNMLGTEEALTYSEMLLEEYRKAPVNRGKKIVWMHSNPFWQKAVKDLFNFQDAQHIVATELGYDAWIEADPSDPWRYMAERLVYNSYNGPVSDRIAWTKRMCDETGADGVVLFCHWGCKETNGASAAIKKELEKAGYPVLILNGDGVDRHNSSDGQTQTRLEAFLEMLEVKA